MVDLKQIQEKVEKDLAKGLVDARILLDRFRVIDEASRQTSAYTDPTYIPFYYHFGKYTSPQIVLEMGLRLGLFGGCLLTSCHTAEKYIGFQQSLENVFYSPSLARSNIRRVFKGDFYCYVGDIFDKKFEDMLDGNVDLAIINEEMNYEKHRLYLDFLWQRMKLDGIIIMDYVNFHEPCKKSFLDFCKIVNREPIICKTRYGTGLIQR